MSRVIVYGKALFCGRYHDFGPGRYDFDTLQPAVDSIGSIRIPPGWKVSLFSNAGFLGAAGVLTSSNVSVDATSLIVEAPAGWASQPAIMMQGKLVVAAYSAAWKSGPSRAMIAINGALVEKFEDGIHVVALDDEGKVLGEHLAAHPSPSLEALRALLDGLPNGCFIVAAIRGEGVDYNGNADKHEEFTPLWAGLGSQQFGSLTAGESWAFVAKKGSGVLKEARSTSPVLVECIAVEGTRVAPVPAGQLVIAAHSSGHLAGNAARIVVNGQVLCDLGTRGINVVAVDAFGTVIGAQRYDTHAENKNAEMKAFLVALPVGCFIIAAVKDEASGALSAEARSLWSSLGSKEIQSLGWREGWVFITQKGGAVIKEVRSPETEAISVDVLAVAGKFRKRQGRVSYFNGTDNYVSIPLNEPETGVTHECWFRTESPDGGILSAVSTDLGTNGDREIWLEGGKLKARLAGEEIATKGLFLADGKWHHVAHVFGNAISGQRLYVDGVLQVSGTVSTSTFTQQARINLGYAPKGPQPFFAGRLAEVRLWRFAKSDAEVKRDMLRIFPRDTPDLLGYYRFQNILGPLVRDTSVNKRTGMLRGTVPVQRRPSPIEASPIFVPLPKTSRFVKERRVKVEVTASQTNLTIDTGKQWFNALWGGYFVVTLKDDGTSIEERRFFDEPELITFLEAQPLGRIIIIAAHALRHGPGDALVEVLAKLGSEKALAARTRGWGLIARKGIGVIREETTSSDEQVVPIEGSPIGYSEKNYEGTATTLEETRGIRMYSWHASETPKFQSFRVPRGWRLSLENGCVMDGDVADFSVAESFVDIQVHKFDDQTNVAGVKFKAAFDPNPIVLSNYERPVVYTEANYAGSAFLLMATRDNDILISGGKMSLAGAPKLGAIRIPRGWRVTLSSNAGTTTWTEDVALVEISDTLEYRLVVEQLATAPDAPAVLVLDGDDDFVAIEINEPETEVTHEFWFMTDSPNAGMFCATVAEMAFDADREIWLEDGNVYARLWSNEIICSKNLNLADGRWHHVAHVFGASIGGQRLYVDGRPVAAGNRTRSALNGQKQLHVGYTARSQRPFFPGRIAEVRVWSRVRDEIEIALSRLQRLTGNESKLIGYWKLDETAGTVVRDSSSLQRHGSLRGETPATYRAGHGRIVGPFPQSDGGPERGIEVQIRSAGIDAGDAVLIQVGTTPVIQPGGTGVNIVVIDPAEGKVLDSKIFDVSTNIDASQAMMVFLDQLPNHCYIAAALKTDATGMITAEAREAWARLGSRKFDKLDPNQCWCILLEKGGSVFREEVGPRMGRSAIREFLTRKQPVVIGPPLPPPAGTISLDIRTWGADYTFKYASIKVGGVEMINEDKHGINVVTLDGFGTLMAKRAFAVTDTSAPDKLVSFLNGLADGTIVIAAVRSDAAALLNDAVKQAWKSVGSHEIDALGANTGWAIVTMKGGQCIAERRGSGQLALGFLPYGIQFEGQDLTVNVAGRTARLPYAQNTVYAAVMKPNRLNVSSIVLQGAAGEGALLRDFFAAIPEGSVAFVASSYVDSRYLSREFKDAFWALGSRHVEEFGGTTDMLGLIVVKGEGCLLEQLNSFPQRCGVPVPFHLGQTIRSPHRGSPEFHCAIAVRSAGRDAGDRAFVAVNGRDVTPSFGYGALGINAVAVSSKGEVLDVKVFDTGNLPGDSETMCNWIDSFPLGTFMAFAVRGDAVRCLTEEGRARLSMLGSKRMANLAERDSFAMIVEKGIGCSWENSGSVSVYGRLEIPLVDDRHEVANVVFYNHPDYRGFRTEVPLGKYASFPAGQTAKSVRLPSIAHVSLYDLPDFDGAKLTLRGNLGAWNGRIASLEAFDWRWIPSPVNTPVPSMPPAPPAPPVIPAPLRVHVVSEGVESDSRFIALEVNGQDQLGPYTRGITIVVFSGEDGRKLDQRSYNTNPETSTPASMALVEYLNTIPLGCIIVGMVYDDAQRSLHPKVAQAFKALGCRGLVQLGYRHSWAAVIRKGFGCLMEAVGPHRVEFDLPVLLGFEPVRYQDAATLDPQVNAAIALGNIPLDQVSATAEERPAGRIDFGLYSAGDDHGSCAIVMVNGTLRLVNPAEKEGEEGVNIIVLDKVTGKTIAARRFDTSDEDDASLPMANFLTEQPAGSLIVAAVKIDAKEEIQPIGRDCWKALGSKFFESLQEEQGWVIVVEKGTGVPIFEAKGSQVWAEIITGVGPQRQTYTNDLETPPGKPISIVKPVEEHYPPTKPAPTAEPTIATTPPKSGLVPVDDKLAQLLAHGIPLNLLGIPMGVPLTFIAETRMSPAGGWYVYEGKARLGAPFHVDVTPLTLTIHNPSADFFITWESPKSIASIVSGQLGGVPDGAREVLERLVIPALEAADRPTLVVSTAHGEDHNFGGVAPGLNIYAPLNIGAVTPIKDLGNAIGVDFNQFHPHMHVSNPLTGFELEVECTIEPGIKIIKDLVVLEDISVGVAFGTGENQQLGITYGIHMRFAVHIFGETFYCAGGLTTDGKDGSFWGAVDVEDGAWKNPFGIPGVTIRGLGFEVSPEFPWIAGRGEIYLGSDLIGGEFAVKADPNSPEKSMVMLRAKNGMILFGIMAQVVTGAIVNAAPFLKNFIVPIQNLDVYLVPNATVIANQLYPRGMMIAGDIVLFDLLRCKIRSSLHFTGLSLQGEIEPVRLRAFGLTFFELGSPDGKSGPMLRVDLNASRQEGRVLGHVVLLEVFRSEMEIRMGADGFEFDIQHPVFGPLYSGASVRISDEGFKLKQSIEFDVDIPINGFDIVPDVSAELSLAIRGDDVEQVAKFDVDAFGHSWTFRTEIDFALRDIGDLIKVFVDRFVGELKRFFAEILKNAILYAFKWVAEHVAYAARRVAELFQTFAARVKDVAKGLKQVFDDIDDVAEALLDAFDDLGDDALEEALEFAGFAADEIEDFFEDLWDFIKGIFD